MLLVGVVVVAVDGDLTHSTKLGCRLNCGSFFSPVRTGNIFFSTIFKLSPDQDELGAH